MAKQKSTARPTLRQLARKLPRNKWPVLSDDDQQTIRYYLAGWCDAAVTALEAARTMNEIDPGNVSVAGNLEYWRNVISAISWLESHLSHRQAYLAVQLLVDTAPKD